MPRTRLVVWLVGVVLVAAGCGGDGDATDVALGEHVVGGDLQLVMQPGEGPGEFADSLVAFPDIEMAFGGARPGTADHVAWIDGAFGPVHFVTFTAGRENPRGGAPELCVFAGGGGGCRFDPAQPALLDFALLAPFQANVYAGPGGAEAVFVTESSRAVSVLTVGGFAHAEWPDEWGPPQVVEFYDTDGDLLSRLEYPADG